MSLSGGKTRMKRVMARTKQVVTFNQLSSSSTSTPGGESSGMASTSSTSDGSLPERFKINTDALKASVSKYFGRECTSCTKFAEGGFHSIYLLKLDTSSRSSSSRRPSEVQSVDEVVARVAFPSFSHDKMESEAATKLYLRSHSKVPIPKIYFWDSDANNAVGAEYMIMEKVEGQSGADAWPSFSLEQKTTLIKQLAVYMSDLFTLRVSAIGSLYTKHTCSLDKQLAKGKAVASTLSEDDKLQSDVGPVVCTLYCRDPDDEFPRSPVENPTRGPFENAGSWLSSILQYELDYITQHGQEPLDESLFLPGDSATEDESTQPSPQQQQQLDLAKANLSSLMQIVKEYYGPHDHLSSQFALLHHDFRLSNLQVDPNTAQITAILDWECTHAAPLWACARLPKWLQDPTPSSTSDDFLGKSSTNSSRKLAVELFDSEEEETVPVRISSPSTTRALPTVDREEIEKLRVLFLQEVSPEWREAYEAGKQWRKFQELCSLTWMSWTEECMTRRIEAYQEQARAHPGVPLDEEHLDKLLNGSAGSSEHSQVTIF